MADTSINFRRTDEEIIDADKEAKRKKKISNQRYRDKLKQLPKQEIDKLKEKTKIYKRKYRLEVKKKVLQARVDNPNVRPREKEIAQDKIQEIEVEIAQPERVSMRNKEKQASIDIPVWQNKTIRKETVPKWKQNLPKNKTPTPKEIEDAKKLESKARDKNLNTFKLVYEKVRKQLFKPEQSNLVLKVYLGKPTTKKEVIDEFPFLDDKFLMKFINNVQKEYPPQDDGSGGVKNNSFITNLQPFVNLLSRVEQMNKEYQQMTQITSDERAEEQELRKENKLAEEDADKILDLEPNNVKDLIKRFLPEPRDKALAAVYLLQPPRRVMDYQLMRLTFTTDPKLLSNNSENYLIAERNGGKIEPVEFVFNAYKTSKEKGFGQQTELVNSDVKPYLTEYLNKVKFFEKNYIFGQITKSYKEPVSQSAFSESVSDFTLKMYGVKASANWIRKSASTRIDTQGMTVKQREAYAKRMGHTIGQSALYVKKVVKPTDESKITDDIHDDEVTAWLLKHCDVI